MTATATRTDPYLREQVRLLAAIATATQAVHGVPNSPAVARWVRYRAHCYRQLAHNSGDPTTVAMALGAAALDENAASEIETGGVPVNADLWNAIDTQSRAVLTALETDDMSELALARLDRAELLDQLADTDSDYAVWAASLAALDRRHAASETTEEG